MTTQRPTWTVTLGIIVLAALFILPSSAHAQKFVPPDGKRIFIIGQDYDTINVYLAATKNLLPVPAGFSTYTNISNGKEFGLTTPVEFFGGRFWAQGHMDDHPNTLLLIAVWLDYENVLDDILNKKSDAQIEYLAKYIKSIQRPVFLRIGYEPDNEWHVMNSGSWTDKRRNAEKFKTVYNYIAGKIKNDYKVDNVAFVWHCMAGPLSIPYNAQTNAQVPSDWEGAMEWYPGDQYADWFAILV